MAPMTVAPLPVPCAAATSAWACAISAKASRVRSGQLFRLPGGAHAVARHLEQLRAEGFLQLPRRAVHRGAGAPDAPCGTGEGARLHHRDERLQLRGSYAPQDLVVVPPGRARAHRRKRLAQHLQGALDALRGRAAGAGEREPRIAALHEARSQGRLDLRHRLRHRGLA